MANVIDITGLPPERIVFSPSPLAELSAALHALSEPGHHPGLHGWVTATNAALKADLADRLCEADFLWRSSRSDILLPARPGATLAEELDELDKIDDERFVAAAFEISCSATYTRPTPSPLVDADERARVREMAAARGPRQAAFTDRMLTDPDGLRVWLRRLFEDCEEAFFGDIWRRVGIQLAADARHKTELLRRKGLAETLSATSAALSLEEAQDGSGGARIVVDKLAGGRTTAYTNAADPGVTLLPTSFGWPHLVVSHAPGWRPVVQYPVASPELPPCGRAGTRTAAAGGAGASDADAAVPHAVAGAAYDRGAGERVRHHPAGGVAPCRDAEEGRAGPDPAAWALCAAPAGPPGGGPAGQRLP